MSTNNRLAPALARAEHKPLPSSPAAPVTMATLLCKEKKSNEKSSIEKLISHIAPYE